MVGQRGEVWTLDVDPSQTRLATGSADGELRLYRIAAEGDEEGQQEAAAPNGAANGLHKGQKQQQGQQGDGEGGEEGGQRRRVGEVLIAMGSVRRQAPERAALVRYSGQAAGDSAGGGVLLTCQSAGKVGETVRHLLAGQLWIDFVRMGVVVGSYLMTIAFFGEVASG